MTDCYIALGSNLGNPLQQLESALDTLATCQDLSLLACSPWYRSAAMGPGEQPDYINGVAALRTNLSPGALLDKLQAVEQAHGRERGARWTARTLDLDILLYGAWVVDETHLHIPHPRMRERNFVLYPLFDLAPDLTLPCGTELKSLLAACPRTGLQPLGEFSDPGR